MKPIAFGSYVRAYCIPNVRQSNKQLRKIDRADLQFYILAEQILDLCKRAPVIFSDGNSVIKQELLKLVARTFSLRSGTLMNTTRSMQSYVTSLWMSSIYPKTNAQSHFKPLLATNHTRASQEAFFVLKTKLSSLCSPSSSRLSQNTVGQGRGCFFKKIVSQRDGWGYRYFSWGHCRIPNCI